MKIQNGTILNEKYRILSLVGEGGYSYVYKAEDIALGKVYALKQTGLFSSSLKKQFISQTSLLIKLRHPNLPVVQDYFFDNDFFFIVSDFIEGKDLRKYVTERGAQGINFSLNIIIQIARTVNYLHTSRTISILHRDIKPANIIIDNKQDVFLVDFGLMKLDKSQETETIAKAFTRGYSPIEQYGQEKTDVRSDIYSLAATLYYLLTGLEPQESVSRISEDHIPLNIKAVAGISDNLVRIILIAMAVNPKRRYEDVEEFLKELVKENERYELLDQQKLPLPPQEEISDDISSVRKLKLTLSYRFFDDGRCENILAWDNFLRYNLKFRVVRKYFVLPKNPADGDFWDVVDSPLIDSDVENGILVCYSLYLNDLLIGSVSGMRVDEIYDLRIDRDFSKAIISFRLPNHAKSIIIRKSYTKPPSNIFEGLKVTSNYTPVSGTQDLVSVEDDVEDIPVFYTVFCRYLKNRSVFVTSKGKSIHV